MGAIERLAKGSLMRSVDALQQKLSVMESAFALP
jgi:hypothetical protein